MAIPFCRDNVILEKKWDNDVLFHLLNKRVSFAFMYFSLEHLKHSLENQTLSDK